MPDAPGAVDGRGGWLEGKRLGETRSARDGPEGEPAVSSGPPGFLAWGSLGSRSPARPAPPPARCADHRVPLGEAAGVAPWAEPRRLWPPRAHAVLLCGEPRGSVPYRGPHRRPVGPAPLFAPHRHGVSGRRHSEAIAGKEPSLGSRPPIATYEPPARSPASASGKRPRNPPTCSPTRRGWPQMACPIWG